MLRLLAAAAALCTVINADETVTLKRDAPPADEPEVQASMNSLGGAFMPAPEGGVLVDASAVDGERRAAAPAQQRHVREQRRWRDQRDGRAPAGDDGVAAVEQPSQENLHCGDVVACGDAQERRVRRQLARLSSKRRVGLQDDIILFVVLLKGLRRRCGLAVGVYETSE